MFKTQYKTINAFAYSREAKKKKKNQPTVHVDWFSN